MRRLVIGGLVAAVGALSMGCAQAIKTVETVPGKGTSGPEATTVHTMSLVFHDPAFGGCKLLEKPGRIRASVGGRDVVLWQVANHCNDRLDVCLVGFFPEKDESPIATTPDPLEDVDDQNAPQRKRRCDRINVDGTGRIRTRVRSDAVQDEYEYNIRARKRGREWKTVDPMIDIVP